MLPRFLFILLWFCSANAQAQPIFDIYIDHPPEFVIWIGATSKQQNSSIVKDGSRIVITPSDSLQNENQEKYWFAFTLKNESSRTKWRLATRYFAKSPSLYLVDPNGDSGLWPIEKKTAINSSRESYYYFPLDFSGSPQLTILLHLDSTASGKYYWNLETEPAVSDNIFQLGLVAGGILIILIMLLGFLLVSRDVIYAVSVFYFLGTAFWLFVQVLNYPIYALHSFVTRLFQWISDPSYYIIFPLLLNQTFKRSILVYPWIVFAALMLSLQVAIANNAGAHEWVLWLASKQFQIVSSLIMAGSIEQLIRKRKPSPYYYLCFMGGASILAVQFIISEVSYFIYFIPDAILLIILIYRFILTLQQRKKKSVADAIEHGKALSSTLIEIQESERERISRDLHDEVGSTLAALKVYAESIKAEQVPQMKQIIEQLDRCWKSVRSISHNLLPPEFTSTSIEELLRDHIHLISSNSSINFQFLVSGEVRPLSPQFKLTVFRIILELATNVIKHSQAANATIQINYFHKTIQLLCEDDGKGFVDGDKTGIGLQNIRSRVNFLHGNVHLETGNNGTTIIVELPLISAVPE